MSTHSEFRLSTYLTLAFAAAALGFAEVAMFPEVGVFAVLVIISLAVIYRLEARLEVLSISDANKLGAGIAILSLGWVGYRVLREIRLTEFATYGWQMLGMALFGAVLILLIPAKLLRKEKHAGDWWGMHAMGLAAFALAGAMADGTVIFALLAGYVICGVWSLIELSRSRNTGAVPPVPQKSAPGAPTARIAYQPPRFQLGVGRGLFWVVCATAVAVPLFLVTPRSTAARFTFGQPRVEIGYAGSQMIDLKRTGTLEDNPEPAFEVYVENADGSPKTDLGPDRRWRGTTLSKYGQGEWSPQRFRFPPLAPSSEIRTPTAANRWVPPNFGPDAYRIHFLLPPEEKSHFLADPIVWEPGQFVPVASECPNGLLPWSITSDSGATGTFLRASCRGPLGGTRYVQFMRETGEENLGTGFELAAGSGPYLDQIVGNFPPRVKEYADTLLAKLVREGQLPPEASGRGSHDRVRLRPAEDYHEAIARAFSRHLSDDPGFGYTTNIRRKKVDTDPIEEFLFDLRAGHCERFAAALVMMLRSQGIPAVLVLGFRGCESLGDGKYVIRQQDAHVWVEALISRRGGPVSVTNPEGKVWHWLSLDPFPARSLDDDAANQSGGMVGRAWYWMKGIVDSYFLNYSATRREKALHAVREVLTDPVTWIGAACIVSVVVVIVRVRRRKRAAAPPLSSEPGGWFAQLVRLLETHGFTVQPGDTPFEYATNASDELSKRPNTAPVASVPLEWAEAYYQTRFGGTPLAPERRAELDARLTALGTALRM